MSSWITTYWSALWREYWMREEWMGSPKGASFPEANLGDDADKSECEPTDLSWNRAKGAWTAKFVRILDADHRISFGIAEGAQVLIFGDTYFKLSHFYQNEEKNYLHFTFGPADIMIHKMVSEGGENVYRFRLICELEHISKQISPFVVKYTKPIGLKGVSDQLDHICELFSSEPDAKSCT